MKFDSRSFKSRFRIPQFEHLIGYEIELFLACPKTGKIVSGADKLLPHLPPEWTRAELSNCQIEIHIGPGFVGQLETQHRERLAYVRAVAADHGYSLLLLEVAPEDMPLDIYPDARYLAIAESLRKNGREDVLRAGCRIAGTHIHGSIVMPEGYMGDPYEGAVDMCNYVSKFVDEYMWTGDPKKGERMRLYEKMISDPYPYHLANWKAYEELIVRVSPEKLDPRDNWRLVRISEHGTVENRVPGITEDISQIIHWCDQWNRRCIEASQQLLACA